MCCADWSGPDWREASARKSWNTSSRFALGGAGAGGGGAGGGAGFGAAALDDSSSPSTLVRSISRAPGFLAGRAAGEGVDGTGAAARGTSGTTARGAGGGSGGGAGSGSAIAGVNGTDVSG